MAFCRLSWCRDLRSEHIQDWFGEGSKEAEQGEGGGGGGGGSDGSDEEDDDEGEGMLSAAII